MTDQYLLRLIDDLDRRVKALEQEPFEDLINQRATTCRHGGHCEWVACDKCNHYEPDHSIQQPCDDAISRQAVLEIMKKSWLAGTVAHRIIDEIGLSINDLPSVIPKEKTGRWIDDADKIDAQFDRHEYKCSVCGRIANYYVGGNECWWDIYKPNFCPNCGARMIEPQESEE